MWHIRLATTRGPTLNDDAIRVNCGPTLNDITRRCNQTRTRLHSASDRVITLPLPCLCPGEDRVARQFWCLEGYVSCLMPGGSSSCLALGGHVLCALMAYHNFTNAAASGMAAAAPAFWLWVHHGYTEGHRLRPCRGATQIHMVTSLLVLNGDRLSSGVRRLVLVLKLSWSVVFSPRVLSSEHVPGSGMVLKLSEKAPKRPAVRHDQAGFVPKTQRHITFRTNEKE